MLQDMLSQLHRPIRVRGIDLGTTNSTVAEIHWNPQQHLEPQARCLDLEQPTLEGVHTSPLVPSGLAVRGDGSHWVGEGAKRLRANPQQAKLQVGRTLFFETKNDMGTRRTYFGAGSEYDHASKIAGHVLRFLNSEADRTSGGRAERTVVTVPASFQLNQRRDTLLAAERAGLQLTDYDLLDEPTAALIAYMYATPDTKSVIFKDSAGGSSLIPQVQEPTFVPFPINFRPVLAELLEASDLFAIVCYAFD